jgi:conjugative transposon protein TcpC
MSWWRSLLNLPPKGERWADGRRPPKKRGAVQDSVPDQDWWEPSRPAPRRAGTATATRPARNGVRTAPPPRPDEGRDTPWAAETESSFSTWGRRFLRGLVVVVLLLAAATGVRTWIRPSGSDAPPVSAEASYPRDDARAVGSRFAVSYLTWNEDARDARPAAIGMDLAAGLDKTVGWNGQGRQSAGTAIPGEVRVGDDGITAKVDVRVQVTPYSKATGEWRAGTPAWRRISVPVARTGDRVVVSGAPAFVSDWPASLPADMPGSPAPDEELTQQTKGDAEAFFKAYATSNDQVAALTAPGAGITSLNGAVKFEALRSWQVFAGSADERQAAAAVTWTGSDKTTLAQTYTVTLRRTVAADGAERWNVAAIG